MKNLRNFGITLAVSIVILAIAAIFACSFVADNVCSIFTGGSKDLSDILNPIEPVNDNKDKNDKLSKEISGESFTWLWAVSDYRPNVFDNYFPGSVSDVKGMKDFGILGADYRFPEATNIVLIHADVKTREYLITVIPSITRVSTPAGNMTLGKVYALGGIEELAEKVGTMTGLNIDYYTVMHSTDLSKLANTIGSIEMTLPVDVYSDGKNYVSAPKETDTADSSDSDKDSKKDTSADTSKDGETTVTYTNELDRAESVKLAKKLMSALLYYDDTDGITDEMTIMQSFAVGVMENLSSCSDSQLTAMLNGLGGSFVSNNVSTNAVILSGEVIRAYTWFDVSVVTYPGRFIAQRGNSDAYYKPDVDEGVAMFYKYR